MITREDEKQERHERTRQALAGIVSDMEALRKRIAATVFRADLDITEGDAVSMVDFVDELGEYVDRARRIARRVDFVDELGEYVDRARRIARRAP